MDRRLVLRSTMRRIIGLRPKLWKINFKIFFSDCIHLSVIPRKLRIILKGNSWNSCDFFRIVPTNFWIIRQKFIIFAVGKMRRTVKNTFFRKLLILTLCSIFNWLFRPKHKLTKAIPRWLSRVPKYTELSTFWAVYHVKVRRFVAIIRPCTLSVLRQHIWIAHRFSQHFCSSG